MAGPTSINGNVITLGGAAPAIWNAPNGTTWVYIIGCTVRGLLVGVDQAALFQASRGTLITAPDGGEISSLTFQALSNAAATQGFATIRWGYSEPPLYASSLDVGAVQWTCESQVNCNIGAAANFQVNPGGNQLRAMNVSVPAAAASGVWVSDTANATTGVWVAPGQTYRCQFTCGTVFVNNPSGGTVQIGIAYESAFL